MWDPPTLSNKRPTESRPTEARVAARWQSRSESRAGSCDQRHLRRRRRGLAVHLLSLRTQVKDCIVAIRGAADSAGTALGSECRVPSSPLAGRPIGARRAGSFAAGLLFAQADLLALSHALHVRGVRWTHLLVDGYLLWFSGSCSPSCDSAAPRLLPDPLRDGAHPRPVWPYPEPSEAGPLAAGQAPGAITDPGCRDTDVVGSGNWSRGATSNTSGSGHRDIVAYAISPECRAWGSDWLEEG
jgi:hypothetical protein